MCKHFQSFIIFSKIHTFKPKMLCFYGCTITSKRNVNSAQNLLMNKKQKNERRTYTWANSKKNLMSMKRGWKARKINNFEAFIMHRNLYAKQTFSQRETWDVETDPLIIPLQLFKDNRIQLATVFTFASESCVKHCTTDAPECIIQHGTGSASGCRDVWGRYQLPLNPR